MFISIYEEATIKPASVQVAWWDEHDDHDGHGHSDGNDGLNLGNGDGGGLNFGNGNGGVIGEGHFFTC